MEDVIRVMRDVVLHAWGGAAGSLAVQLSDVQYERASRLYVSEGPSLFRVSSRLRKNSVDTENMVQIFRTVLKPE